MKMHTSLTMSIATISMSTLVFALVATIVSPVYVHAAKSDKDKSSQVLSQPAGLLESLLSPIMSPTMPEPVTEPEPQVTPEPVVTTEPQPTSPQVSAPEVITPVVPEPIAPQPTATQPTATQPITPQPTAPQRTASPQQRSTSSPSAPVTRDSRALQSTNNVSNLSSDQSEVLAFVSNADASPRSQLLVSQATLAAATPVPVTYGTSPLLTDRQSQLAGLFASGSLITGMLMTFAGTLSSRQKMFSLLVNDRSRA